MIVLVIPSVNGLKWTYSREVALNLTDARRTSSQHESSTSLRSKEEL